MGPPTLDAQVWEALEVALLAADLGASTAVRLIEVAQFGLLWAGARDAAVVRAVLREQLLGLL